MWGRDVPRFNACVNRLLYQVCQRTCPGTLGNRCVLNAPTYVIECCRFALSTRRAGYAPGSCRMAAGAADSIIRLVCVMEMLPLCDCLHTQKLLPTSRWRDPGSATNHVQRTKRTRDPMRPFICNHNGISVSHFCRGIWHHPLPAPIFQVLVELLAVPYHNSVFVDELGELDAMMSNLSGGGSSSDQVSMSVLRRELMR